MKTKDTVLKMCCRTERHKRAESGEIPYHLFLGMGLVVVLLFAGIGIVGATADYYVATWGSDDKKGTSVDEPWEHPSYAAQQAQAGDTIYLIDGTWYDEHIVFANSGNDTHPITITAYNGTPTLDGVDKTGIGIESSYHSYIDITGRLFIKNYYHGIYITHSTGMNINEITITSLGYAGIHFHGSNSYITINGTEITHTGHAAIWAQVPNPESLIQHLTITNNIFDDNNHASINIHNNNHDVLIENNVISNAGGGAGIGIHNYNMKNITVRNNTLESCWRGMWLIGIEDCLVEGNTISNSYSHYGIFLYTYSEPLSWIRNVTIRNNIVRNSEAYDIYLATYKAGVEVSDIVFENNSIKEPSCFEGPNILDITIRNIPDATRTLMIDNAVSNLQIEFDNDKTFKLNEDAGGHTSATLTGVGTYIIEVEGTAPDTTTPTTNATIIPAPNNEGWNHVTPVVVTSFRSDSSGSGISHTNYSKMSETGPWTTVDTATATGPDAENVAAISESGFNVTVSDEGTTQIWYYSVDNDSNVEHVKDVTVKIDTTASGIIAGIVTNTTGALIQGATVTVEGTLKTAETDATGVYTLTDVPINTYTVTCTAPDYQDSYHSNIAVSEGVTTQVIFALISSTITPLGDLAGEWRFEEGTEGIAVDSSGNENNGIIHGSANWTAGKISSALEFDGLDDYVMIPNSPTLNPAEEITLLAWVNPGVIPQDGWNKIIAKPYTNSSSPWQQYALTLHDNQFVFELNTEGTKDAIASTETLEPNTWYHVTGTYDGSEMRIYVNAALNGTLPKSGAIAAYPTDVHIGAGIYSDAETEYINGTVDEVKIYSRALCAEEINADYEEGLTGAANTLSGTITSLNSTGLVDATVTLATMDGDVINTTLTDNTGNYEFADVAPGDYNITATKPRFWYNFTVITVNANVPTTADILLSMKGDFNINGDQADAGDLVMMEDAKDAGTSDVTYDLNGDGNLADADDLTLLKNVSVGEAVLE